MYTAIVNKIVAKYGGFREYDVLSKPHTITKTATWNDAHRVLEVLEKRAGPDGYRNGFQVDIVTMSICG